MIYDLTMTLLHRSPSPFIHLTLYTDIECVLGESGSCQVCVTASLTYSSKPDLPANKVRNNDNYRSISLRSIMWYCAGSILSSGYSLSPLVHQPKTILFRNLWTLAPPGFHQFHNPVKARWQVNINNLPAFVLLLQTLVWFIIFPSPADVITV